MKRAIVMILFAPLLAWAGDKVSLSFLNARLPDVLRVVYSDVLGASVVLDDAVVQSSAVVTLDLRGLTPGEIGAGVAEVASRHGFQVVKRGHTYVVQRADSTAMESFAYVPQHRPASWLADLVGVVVRAGSLSGRAGGVSMASSAAGVPLQAQPQPQPLALPSAKSGDRDALVYVGPPQEAANVRKLLVELDTPAGEVVLKAAVFEVGVKDSEGSALSLAASVLSGRVGLQAGAVIDGARLAVRAGGVEAVISALGTDDRFKVVSRPQVRVRSGGTARFTVGNETPVEGSAVLDRNGNPVRSIDYRPSGVILTAKPVVRAGGVDLEVVQEISSYSQTSSGVASTPTLSKRVIDTALTLQPGEVVIMAGLDQISESTHADRVPVVDWLLGRGQSQQKTELMVFVEAQRI